MSMQRCVLHVLYTLAFVTALAPLASGQTITDGIMMGSRELQTANIYSHDGWDEYWEGTLKRANGNVGRVTTETNVWSANYGLTDRLNVLAMVPYVWTNASQGVFHGIHGFQDLALAGKWSVVNRPLTSYGSLRTIFVLSAGIPLTNYNPELLPLSIGMGSTNVSWRGTVNFQSTPGWYLNGSTAYTWRSQVQLDRPYFFTDGEFVMSDQVDMPNVFDYVATAGFMRRGLMTEAFFSQQQTLGGGDIRRQDMPFISNRMNFFKAGAMIMSPVPKLRPLAVQFALAHTFAGRNVGQATTLTMGLLYTFNGGPR
jgi:hypothetical protein